mgnify:FL=1
MIKLKLEPKLEALIFQIANEKNVPISKYCHHLLYVGLDAIYRKNKSRPKT